jgi:hypothetical protein
MIKLFEHTFLFYMLLLTLHLGARFHVRFVDHANEDIVFRMPALHSHNHSFNCHR